MLHEEIGKWFKRLFFKGARPDVDMELLPEGCYLDAGHMRPNSVDGAAGALEHMGGETLLWGVPSGINPLGYECIGSAEGSGDEIAFWCHVNGVIDPAGNPPFVTVNGVVMAKSPRIPYRFDRKMQLGDVSRCAMGSGVVFPADAESAPLFWDIADMRAAFNSGSQKYFTAFDPLSISVLPAGPRDWFEFMGFQQGAGLPPGGYVYWPRFITPQGDRTNPGPPTPMIRMPSTVAPMYDVGPNDGQYPGGQSTGGPTDVNSQTQWAPKLRILIDNYLGMRELEIVRQSFNNGEGVNGAGVVEVIARIPIADLTFGYIDFVDPVESNYYELIPPNVAAQQNVVFTAPTTVEHVDNRVIYGGVQFLSRAPRLEFREVNGRKAVPITNRVFTRYGTGTIEYDDGHAEPVNAVYMQGAMHNERYGLGAMLWDGLGGSTFVSPIEADMQMPDRKDVKDGDSMALSYNRNAPYGTPGDPIYGSNNNCQDVLNRVSPTFDAIVQGDKRKYNTDFTSILASGSYEPPRPASPTDPNFVRYRQQVTDQWATSPPANYQADINYSYAPQKHVLGAAVYGPTNIDSEAPYWEVMDFMATPPPGRVVAEGIGCYDIINRSKYANVLRCHFPDIESLAVEESVVNDMLANPSRYKLKLVPYGYGMEVYHSAFYPALPGASKGCDILNNMDVQYDHGIAPLSVNAGTTPGSQGVQPGALAPATPTNHVGYSAFRTTPVSGITNPADPQYSVFMDPNNTDQGSKLFGITGAVFMPEGRGSYLRITTDDNIYRLEGQSIPAGQNQFWTDDAKRFAEPFYVVQIIREAVTVPQLNIQDYRSTGYRVARERTIILAPTPPAQWTVDLFHARVEDCVVMPGSTEMRYVWVRETGQPDKRWLCFTNAVGVNFAAAITAFAGGGSFIDPEGNEVWGAYAYSSDIGDKFVKHRLTFNQYGSVVPAGARVLVRYDSRSPVQVFNIDGCTVGQDIFCPLDRTWSRDTDGTSLDTAFPNAPALPYAFGSAPFNWRMPNNPATTELAETGFFGSLTGNYEIRQWAVQGHLTTRTPLHLAVGKDYGGGVKRWRFPAQHYVMRPSVVNSNPNVGINPQYFTDFPGETAYWRMGGFWAWTEYNNDYTKKPLITGKGYPLNGVLPTLDGCNAMPASLRRIPGQVDTPGLRTFTTDNVFYISEENGGIQHICALDQGGMQQLFGWSEDGCFRIPYNKNILVGATGDAIGTQSVSNFWPREEQWITRGYGGMPEKMWRMSATITAPGENTTFASKAWVDRSGAYMLFGGQVRNILVGKYASKLLPLLRTAPADQRKGISSVFNRRNGEWWLSLIDNDGAYNSFVFSVQNTDWVGRHFFEYDNMLQIDARVIGYRGATANELMDGYSFLSAAGEPVTKSVWFEAAFTPFPYLQSEAVKWRVGPDKPDEMRVFDRAGVLMFITNQAIQEAFEPGTGQWWVLNIDNWEQMMGNVIASYDALSEQPPQSTGYSIRWYFSRPERIRASFAMLQARQLP